MKHLWMIIGCILPLLLIFLAPALGLSSQVSMFIFIVFMFACHLLMPMVHGSHDHKQQNSETTKSEKKHGHH